MAVNASRPQQTPAVNSVAPAMAAETGVVRPGSSSAPGAARRSSGYGLPCAKCHLYYPADLDSCPICSARERVSPDIVPAIPRSQAAAEPVPDDDLVEQEREAFLKEFKSQLF